MTVNPPHVRSIARELDLREVQVEATIALLEEGATIPFIARYRKEVTGSLDEVLVTGIRDHLNRIRELESRKDTVLKSLEQHGHLTDALRAAVEGADTLTVLEDLYLPYKPKRRTKASIAREKGLEPLAETLWRQSGADPFQAAAVFLDPEKGVHSVDEALEGARHIIAEKISEDSEARSELRRLFTTKGVFYSRVVADMEEKGAKYRDYFDWQEPVSQAPSHRVLAMRRGEKEDILNIGITPPEEEAIGILIQRFVTGPGEDGRQMEMAVRDSYKRLLSRSMETEARLAAKERADAEAIRVFAENLRQLLLAPPLGAKRVMGVDPGFRTGCKLACLDRQGKLLHHATFYLHQPEKAADLMRRLCKEYRMEAIAVGNGTASRETETFLRKVDLDPQIQIIMVNESGASIYSASETAREEFPDLDLTVRGAVSIGRRLMDPLAELVKIDPKSIGVGQYQHDVDQTALKESLDDVVMSCVNAVGVDANRASVQLLTYVSGLGPQLARNIIQYRDEHGPFRTREVLKKVSRLGPKAFEQSAGFLRITDGENPLDASAVHPESYPIVLRMAGDLDCTVSDLIKSAELRRRIELSDYVSDTVGVPTLKDILDELAKPGRDPREQFETFAFEAGVQTMSDLAPGMRLPGIVTNVTAFGAFVDVGVHQDGLVHISELADRFVKDPAEIVKVQQKVKVTVLDVDVDRKRISLSMRTIPGQKPSAPAKPSGGTPKPVRKKENRPFNNPFADAFQGHKR